MRYKYWESRIYKIELRYHILHKFKWNRLIWKDNIEKLTWYNDIKLNKGWNSIEISEKQEIWEREIKIDNDIQEMWKCN